MYSQIRGIYIGVVQYPEQIYCQKSHTTLPLCLNLISYHCGYHFLIHTWFCILLWPSPPLLWNTRTHQNPPPPYGTVLCRQVWVHTVRFLPNKDMRNHLFLCWNNSILINNHRRCFIAIKTPPPPQGDVSAVASGSAISGGGSGAWGGLFVEEDWLVGSIITIIIVYIVGF